MKRLLEIAHDYLDEMGVCDVAVLKICLLALGIILGIKLPKKWRKPALITAAIIFAATYIPMICKLVKVGCSCGEEE